MSALAAFVVACIAAAIGVAAGVFVGGVLVVGAVLDAIFGKAR